MDKTQCVCPAFESITTPKKGLQPVHTALITFHSGKHLAGKHLNDSANMEVLWQPLFARWYASQPWSRGFMVASAATVAVPTVTQIFFDVAFL